MYVCMRVYLHPLPPGWDCGGSSWWGTLQGIWRAQDCGRSSSRRECWTGGQVSHCHPPLSSSESLSLCRGYIRTTCIRSPFIYIRTFAVVGIIFRMYLHARTYIQYVCVYVCASLCLTISVRTYMFVSVCVCVCMLRCSPALSGQVYVCTVNTYVYKGWMCCNVDWVIRSSIPALIC